MAKAFNPLPWVQDVEIHQIIFVTDWPRWKLEQVRALWNERNPGHELVFKGTKGKNFTGFMQWREK